MTFLIALLALLPLAAPQKPTPCPDIFTYEPRREQNRWYGNIALKTDEDLDGIFVKIVLDHPAEELGNWFGEAIATSDKREFTIRNSKYKLQAGPPVLLRFYVHHTDPSLTPSVVKVKLNGRTICTANKEEITSTTPGVFISQVKARPSEAVELGVHNRSPSRHETTPKSGNDFFPGDFSHFKATKPVKKAECGVVSAQSVALISNGQRTAPGQWPWHAALYRSQGADLSYICGGTLLSANHVLTAAHCVTKPHSNRRVDLNNIIVYLGKYSLKNFGPEVQQNGVLEIKIHPGYNYSNFFNDVAVLKLENGGVETTSFVRPCCLWEGEIDSKKLENKLGTVVGWGYDENQKISDELKRAEMPVVSLSTCLYSNRDFFSRFTTERTFCAGFRNGTSVCNGDSGGGMVFPKIRGESTVWQVRGIVSVSVALQGEAVCDPSHYVVFTDVAQHLDWIRKILKE